MGEAIVKRLRQAGATVITTARSKPNEFQSSDLLSDLILVRLIEWEK